MDRRQFRIVECQMLPDVLHEHGLDASRLGEPLPVGTPNEVEFSLLGLNPPRIGSVTTLR